MFEFWDILFNLLLAFSFFGGIKNINNKFKKKIRLYRFGSICFIYY